MLRCIILRWFERSSIESTELVLESMDVTETGPGLGWISPLRRRRQSSQTEILLTERQ